MSSLLYGLTYSQAQVLVTWHSSSQLTYLSGWDIIYLTECTVLCQSAECASEADWSEIGRSNRVLWLVRWYPSWILIGGKLLSLHMCYQKEAACVIETWVQYVYMFVHAKISDPASTSLPTTCIKSFASCLFPGLWLVKFYRFKAPIR